MLDIPPPVHNSFPYHHPAAAHYNHNIIDPARPRQHSFPIHNTDYSYLGDQKSFNHSTLSASPEDSQSQSLSPLTDSDHDHYPFVSPRQSTTDISNTPTTTDHNNNNTRSYPDPSDSPSPTLTPPLLPSSSLGSLPADNLSHTQHQLPFPSSSPQTYDQPRAQQHHYPAFDHSSSPINSNPLSVHHSERASDGDRLPPLISPGSGTSKLPPSPFHPLRSVLPSSPPYTPPLITDPLRSLFLYFCIPFHSISNFILPIN